MRTRKNNHNTQRRSLADALREFDRLAPGDTASQCRWVSIHRAHFEDHTDPLLRARFLLRAARLRGSPIPPALLIEGLLLALRTFEVNDSAPEAHEALMRLAYWQLRLGYDEAALQAGRAALAGHHLRPADEIMLTAWMCTALAASGRLPDAWQLITHQDLSLRRRLPSGRAPASSDVKASLHLIEAIRARRLTSIYCLDLDGGAPDLAESSRHLDRCVALIQPATSGDPRAALSQTMLAMVHALRGDAARMAGCFETLAADEPGNALGRAVRLYNHGWCHRVLGRPLEALSLLDQALDSLAQQPLSRLHTQIWLDASVCHEAMCNPAKSLEALRRFISGQARLAVLDQQAASALSRAWDHPATGPSGPPAPATADAPARSPRGLRSHEPPILTQAERLFMDSLPRRLAMDMLANEVGVSVRTLQMAARRHRNCTLGDMLRQRLLAHACELLMHSDLPIGSIALKLGYPHSASFARDVKRQHGCTPSELRARRFGHAG